MRMSPHKWGECLYKEEREREVLSLNHVNYSKKASLCKLGREPSPKTKSAGTLILDYPVFRTDISTV